VEYIADRIRARAAFRRHRGRRRRDCPYGVVASSQEICIAKAVDEVVVKRTIHRDSIICLLADKQRQDLQDEMARFDG